MEKSSRHDTVKEIIAIFFMGVFLLSWLNSCTLTFQNTIATGSSDAVDSQQKADPIISPTIAVPLTP